MHGVEDVSWLVVMLVYGLINDPETQQNSDGLAVAERAEWSPGNPPGERGTCPGRGYGPSRPRTDTGSRARRQRSQATWPAGVGEVPVPDNVATLHAVLETGPSRGFARLLPAEFKLAPSFADLDASGRACRLSENQESVQYEPRRHPPALSLRSSP